MKEQEEAELNLVLIRLQRCVEGSAGGHAVPAESAHRDGSLESRQRLGRDSDSVQSLSLGKAPKKLGSFSSQSSAKVSDRNEPRLGIAANGAARTGRDSGSDSESRQKQQSSLPSGSVTPAAAALPLPPLPMAPTGGDLPSDSDVDSLDALDDELMDLL